ncbi:MAG: bifunctional folylpolyglutamate synthase/dihydrofolate synthase [Solirubrobacteraceae bacterium]
MTRAWTYEEAERHLLGLELFGMRFGLDRMRRLTTALGLPQQGYASVHVVGSNGKSSTARMIAAILERHGRSTGAYLSPHLRSFPERVRVGELDVEPAAFAAAVQRAARAAKLVDRTLPDDDSITQFEVLTAAAFDELARREVDVAVIEAGLGGRYDATNVIPSSVQVLTTVSLEHTRWLGPTVRDIAREKLAVVGEGGTLVVGDLVEEAEEEARAAAARHGARLVHAPLDPGVELAVAGRFQRRNFALARAAAEALVGPLDQDAVRAAAAEVTIPGRLEFVDSDPLTIVDGAHNPSGMAALAEAIEELRGGGAAGRLADGSARERGGPVPPAPLVAVLSILDDKDAAAMLRALLPLCHAVVLTSNANPRALSPATLQSLSGQLGGPPAHVEPEPRRAIDRARALAGRDGTVLATGSIYLVSDLMRAPGEGRASML